MQLLGAYWCRSSHRLMFVHQSLHCRVHFMGPKTIILSNHGCTSLHKIHVHLWSHDHQLQVPCVAWIAATVQACADVAVENTIKRHGCCHLSLLCLCSCVCILPVVSFWDCSCASSCGTDCGNRAGAIRQLDVRPVA